MTNSRYIRLQEFLFDSFVLNAPIEIEKGALLLDSQSKAVLLQLKLNILVEDKSKISSVKLKIFGFDDAGIPIEGFSPYSFTYRDIYLNPNKSFGEKTPIILNPAIRKVKVEIENVVYRNGNIWENSEEEIKLPSLKTIDQLDSELNEQLSREITNFTPDQKKRVIYLPQQFDNYWICTCGRPNSNDVDTCSRCMLSKKEAFKISKVALKKKHNEYKERLLAEEKIRLQRASKKRSITAISVVLILILLVVYNFVISPAIKYSQASNFLADKNYEDAISIFESLGDYKDSAAMLSESKYQKAVKLLSEENPAEAIQLFTLLGNYKDSDSLLLEAKYRLAVFYLNDTKDYKEAIQLFTLLNNYKDSAKLLLEAKYRLAVFYLNDTKDYEKAVSIFTSLGNYKDSIELLIESTYQNALKKYVAGDFASAHTILYIIPFYKDSGIYLNKLESLIAVQGTWEEVSFIPNKIIFDGWNVYVYHALSGELGHIRLTEAHITNDGLKFSIGNYNLVYNNNYRSLLDPNDNQFTKISNSSELPVSSLSPSISSSSSSQCQTLRDNLDLALLLSGGEETDLTRYYRNALRDENCGD